MPENLRLPGGMPAVPIIGQRAEKPDAVQILLSCPMPDGRTVAAVTLLVPRQLVIAPVLGLLPERTNAIADQVTGALWQAMASMFAQYCQVYAQNGEASAAARG